MKPLPHAFLYASNGLALPGDGPDGRLLGGETRNSGAGDAYALVDADVGVETLRRAIAGGTTGVALTGCRTGADLQRLAVLLCVAEAEEGLAEGSTTILAVTDGILPAPISPQSLAGKSSRLAAVVWDHKALAHTLGTNRPHTESGECPPAFAAARAAVLLTAAAAGVPAYDSVSDLTDAAFAAACERSRDDGFFGRLAKDPAQMAVIGTTYGRRAPSDRD